MPVKVECIKCGVLILPTTASRNNGMCVPCKNGYREQLDIAKASYEREKELDKTCPYRALWVQLVERVYNQPKGFGGLSEDEKIYFSVGMLDGEVYNGGFEQFFFNSSGEYYDYVETGLALLGADHCLTLLRQAKGLVFGDKDVPKDQEQRRKTVLSSKTEQELNFLDTQYYENPDNLDTKLDDFALEKGLVKNA